jgi:hypothetical protein
MVHGAVAGTVVKMRRWLAVIPVVVFAATAAGVWLARPTPEQPGWVAGALRACDAREVDCLGDQVLARVDMSGPEVVFDAMADLVDADPAIRNCHDVLHYVGRRLVGSHDPLDLVALHAPVCLSGFTHGVVEGVALADLTDAVFGGLVPRLCADLEAKSVARAECLHGLGHALAIRMPNDVVAATSACAVLASDDATRCAQGTIMAFTSEGASLSAELDVELPVPDHTRTAETCAAMEEVVQVVCWDMAWQFFPPQLRGQAVVDAVSAACTEAAAFEPVCMHGVGLTVFNRYLDTAAPSEPAALRRHVAGLFSVCPSAHRLHCIEGVAYSGALFWGSFDRPFGEYPSPCDLLDGVVAAEDLVEATRRCELGESYLRSQDALAVRS